SDVCSSDLRNLFRCQLFFPGNHTFFGNTVFNSPEYIFHGSAMQPEIISKVWPYCPLPFISVASHTVLVVNSLTGTKRPRVCRIFYRVFIYLVSGFSQESFFCFLCLLHFNCIFFVL